MRHASSGSHLQTINERNARMDRSDDLLYILLKLYSMARFDGLPLTVTYRHQFSFTTLTIPSPFSIATFQTNLFSNWICVFLMGRCDCVKEKLTAELAEKCMKIRSSEKCDIKS